MAATDAWKHFCEQFVCYSRRHRWPLAALWFAMLIIAAAFGPQVSDATHDAFSAPPGSAAAKADKEIERFFPEMHRTSAVVVVIHALTPAKNCTVPELGPFETQLRSVAFGHGSHQLVSFSGYFSAVADGLPNADSFVSRDGKLSIITLILNVEDGMDAAMKFADFIRGQVKSLSEPLRRDFEFSLTGEAAVAKEIGEAIGADMSRLDSIVLPIAFIIMAVFVQSLRLLIVPAFCITLSILGSFTVIYGLAHIMDVPSFAPTFVLSVILSLSIDYAIFALTRYREALDSGWDHEESVIYMLSSAGKTILVSGGTLALCLAAMCIIDVPALRAVGICSALSMVVLMVTYFGAAPVILMLFPAFFSKCHQQSYLWPPNQWVAFAKMKWRTRGTGATARPVTAPVAANDSLQCEMVAVKPAAAVPAGECNADADPFKPSTGDKHSPVAWGDIETAVVVSQLESADASKLAAVTVVRHVSKKQLVTDADAAALKASFWWRAGDFLLSWPWNLATLVTVVGLTIWFDIHALTINTTNTLDEGIPRHTAALKGIHQVTDAFGYGSVDNTRVLLVPRMGVSALSDEAFTAAANTVQAIVADPKVTDTLATDFMSVAFAGGSPIPYADLAACINNATSSGSCTALLQLKDQYVSDDGRALLVDFRPRFDPYGSNVSAWIDGVRSVLKRAESVTGHKFYISGSSMTSNDAIHGVWAAMPYVLLATVIVIFIFFAVAFKSILVAIRAVLTVILTLAWIFGFVYRIYTPGEGVLAWTNIAGFQTLPGLFWLSPVLAFSVIVGVSLDYDVFILVRIREFRWEGYDYKTAILLGLTRTGGIITAAGVIMAIAFSALVASSTPLLNIIGSYLFWAVLFDTFIVRSILVPSVSHLLGDWHWWPSKPPAPTKTI